MATTAPDPANLYEFHPLELIPFFRRGPCGLWRDLIYTFIWNSLLAVLFTVLALLWAGRVDVMRLLWLNFAYAQCIGYAIHALYLAGYAIVPRERLSARAARAVFFGGIPVTGVILGFLIGRWLLGDGTVPRWLLSPRGVLALVLNALLITGLLLAVMLPRERAARADAREQCYFEANDKYTSVFIAEGEALIRTSLKELVAQLDPERFWQAHRGTVVNLAHVVSTSRDLAGRLTLGLKTRRERVAVSRAYAHRFKQM